MVFVVLTMLVCLLVSAGVALYVAYTARGRPLPSARPVTGRRGDRPAGSTGSQAPADREARR